MVRVMPSVPRQPTMVVTPPWMASEMGSSGVRVEGPPSPPPPMMCTWPSMKPGTAMRLRASMTSQYRAGTLMSGCMRRILPPPARTSHLPSGEGLWISAFLMRSICDSGAWVREGARPEGYHRDGPGH